MSTHTHVSRAQTILIRRLSTRLAYTSRGAGLRAFRTLTSLRVPEHTFCGLFPKKRDARAGSRAQTLPHGTRPRLSLPRARVSRLSNATGYFSSFGFSIWCLRRRKSRESPPARRRVFRVSFSARTPATRHSNVPSPQKLRPPATSSKREFERAIEHSYFEKKDAASLYIRRLVLRVEGLGETKVARHACRTRTIERAQKRDAQRGLAALQKHSRSWPNPIRETRPRPFILDVAPLPPSSNASRCSVCPNAEDLLIISAKTFPMRCAGVVFGRGKHSL